MSKSIRVSALAKELGMASKDVVDLCNRIGVGVTSASSTMVEAQADRVRRHAEEQGLKREPA
ncbi:MAG: translation initiation factor, partial [Actinomycetota bacterium]